MEIFQKILVAVTSLLMSIQAGIASLPSNTNVAQVGSTVTSKAVLKQSDFQYLGEFDLPGAGIAGDPAFGRGLALRHVNGETRLFGFSWGPQVVYEVKVPDTFATTSPYPMAKLVRDWGDVTHGKSSGELFGLYWDDQDSRLYWTFGNIYNTGSTDVPSIGFSTLNDSDGSSVAVGTWKFSGRGDKATNKCVVAIPQWFADAYTGGKRLGAGCGGYQSIIANGPAHLGPALTAFNSPNLSSNPSGSSLSYVNLVGYPFSNNPVPCDKFAIRTTNYKDDFDGCNPVNGVGRWSWGDKLYFQSGIWIDTPNKSGLVYFPSLNVGREWYETSDLHGEGSEHWWYVYDPADLAAVAQGQKQQYEIQAKNTWQVQYPSISYPLPPWNGVGSHNVTGLAFDSTTNRLYVAIERVSRPAGGAYWGATRIYVYQVLADLTPSVLQPPTPPSDPVITPPSSVTPSEPIPDTVNPVNKFIIGDRVHTTFKLKVRQTPSTNGKALCTQSKNAYGAIIGGPQTFNGYTWWQLNYDSSCDGWSVEDWIVK